MLKDLMDKYENLDAQSALDGEVEVDMDPTVGVVEVITNEDQEHQVTKELESAVEDAEKYEESAKDVENLEEVIEGAEKEEATTESALKVVTAINTFVAKHGFDTPEDRVALGLSDAVTVESANSFPVATRESAVNEGKSLVEKVKAGLKVILDKIIAIFNKIKVQILSFLGNNEATIRKLQGVLSGLDDKVAEGKKLDSASLKAKFPLAKDINKQGLVDILVAANSATTLNKIAATFISGCASKNLNKFNYLEDVKDDSNLQSAFEAKKVLPLRVYGKSIAALTVTDKGVPTIETKNFEPKAGEVSVMSNNDLKLLLTTLEVHNKNQKETVEKLNTEFEKLKGIKPADDNEFLKTAKIESSVSTLTRARMIYVESINATIKNVLQIVAANLAVKAKKAA